MQLPTPVKRALTLLVVSAVIISLSACGWRLRGSEAGGTLQVSTALSGPQSQVYRNIEKRLQQQELLASAQAAEILLALGGEQWQRRSVSVSNNALAAEFQLTLTLAFEAKTADNLPITAKTARISRSYIFDQNDVVGKDKEERILREEMQRDMARQILRQVSAVYQARQ